jgi:competence ComEA-like helix-hairpin-helix protein
MPERTQRTLVAAMGLTLSLLILGLAWDIGQAGGYVEGEQLTRRPPPPLIVDLNSAPAEELMLLPNIGPTMARRIVESRRRQGRFQQTDDLLRVRGIGPKTLERLRAQAWVPPAEQRATDR